MTADDTNTGRQLSSTTVNCSPRWIVLPHSRSQTYGARQNTRASDQQQCLDACVADCRCVAAELGLACWTYNTVHQYLHIPQGIARFEIVRPCIRKSST